LPDEHLHAIRYYQTQADNEAVLAKWRQFSKRRQMSAAISDYANPVFYITTPDLVQWEKDVQTTVAEIRKRYPDKKIIGYLWPQYYSASNSPYFKQFIDAGRWQKMLEISSKYMDGVIIWSDKRDENHQIVRWNDPRIQAIMRATKSFIAAHPKDIAVETLQPPTSSKSLKNSKLK